MSMVLDVGRVDVPTQAAEHVLVARIAAGDQSALAELYDEHVGLVHGVARRVTCDSAAAEDICQEVFVHAWQHCDSFDPSKGTVRAWLGMLAHRRAVDWVRRQERAKAREERSTRHYVVEAVDVAEDVTDVAARSELGRATRNALAMLPPAQRDAIELAFFGGHSYREVADLLGIPEGTAKSRLRLALARLADLLPAEMTTWTAPS